MTDVTRILTAIGEGDPHAAEELLPLVYDELRRLAAQKLAHEKPGQTLQATALVHEAFIRLAGANNDQWDGRGHFFAAAAEAMRRILVENARRKGRIKHGGSLQRVDLPAEQPATLSANDDLLAVDEALERLAAEEPDLAELVKLRFFLGFTVDQSAEMLGISTRKARRDWEYARAWLRLEIS